jgi:polyhydroxyalkanoate synthesis repressor PhaR
VIVIKKYSNRRLYDTSGSQYVNLQQIADLIRAGQRIKVLDAKDGEDLTSQVLLQILLEVQGGMDLLPAGLLHRLIRNSTDHPVQRMLLGQMSAGLSLLDQQLEAFERQSGWTRTEAPPPERPAAEKPSRAPEPPPPEEDPEPQPERPGAPRDGELDDLRARLAALESRLARGTSR